MKLLANPIVLRMAAMLITAGFVFLMGVLAMRWLRRNLSQDAAGLFDTPSAETLPMHSYNAVIQQLKQQKHELESTQQVERRRAKTSENISAAVLSNLSSGVMFFTPDGLLRQANPAAKHILGFASPLGMKAAQIFRATPITSFGSPEANLAEAIESSLREKTAVRHVEARYTTPHGEERILDITVSAVHAPGGEALGAACLVNDQSEIAQIRRQERLRGEMSAEMALELRNSLTTISGYAQQLAASRDPELARQLAADIAAEAAQLAHTIGGFLAGTRAASTAAGI